MLKPLSMTQTEIINLLPAFLRNSCTYSVIVTDLEGKYIYVNDLFKKRFSFLETDFIGKSISFALHPGDLEQCDTAAMQSFRHPDKVFPLQIRKPSNNENEFHWTHWEFSLFKDTLGNPAGILCIGHDITDHKKGEQRILQQDERLSQIIWQQSHEVRSHMVNIMGLYNIIKLDQKISAEEKLQHLDDLLKEVKELDLIIHSIVSSNLG